MLKLRGAEAVKASRLLDLVPMPPANPSASWLMMQGVQIGWRAATRDKRIYEMVRSSVAWTFRPEYDVAIQESR
jgi:hypothetical protein